MRGDDALGLTLGMLLGAYAIVGNVARGDAHLVATHPAWIGLAITPVFLTIALHLAARRGADRAALQRSGMRITGLGAIVFASILGGFAVIWFSGPSQSLALFAFASALVSTLILGVLTTWFCMRVERRAA